MKKQIIKSLLPFFMLICGTTYAQLRPPSDTIYVLDDTCAVLNVDVTPVMGPPIVNVITNQTFGNINILTNAIEYCPNASGPFVDFFGYIVCDSLLTVCDTGSVTVFVESASGAVWPGDANNDGITNNYDLLALGFAFLNQGPARNNLSIQYMAQPALDWNDTIPGGIDKKHTDCNGDGVVNNADTTAILLNYGLSHSKNSQNGNRFVDPTLSVEFNHSNVSANDTLRVLVNLGTQQLPATDVYGIAFSITYNPALMVTNNLVMDFSNSWLRDNILGQSTISISKNLPGQQKLDVAISRINLTTRSGFGELGHFDVVIEDNIDGKRFAGAKFIMQIENAKVISNNGIEIPVFAKGDTTQTDIETSVNNMDLGNGISIYPNPANDYLYLNFKDQAVQSVVILNTTGEQVYFTQNATNKEKINIKGWPSGLYWIGIAAGKKVLFRKLIKTD